MSSFTTSLKGEILDNGNIRLLEPFEYYLTGDHDHIIKVPGGYESDFASVPQIFQWAVPKIGRHSKPAVLHDYLVTLSKDKKVTRDFADFVFLESMTIKKVNPVTKYLAYYAVRFYTYYCKICRKV